MDQTIGQNGGQLNLTPRPLSEKREGEKNRAISKPVKDSDKATESKLSDRC